jgi:hypothetical protein
MHTIATPLFMVAALAISGRGDLPSGWRHPSAKELSDLARKDSPVKYAKVVADFNADGTDDTALLLKSQEISGEALWVHLSKVQGGFNWVKLADIKWGSQHSSVDLAMGIDIVQPGVIAYGCFDGAEECNFGYDNQRPKLKLSSPSLMYFKLEGAASLFFWSNKYKKFMRVWLSD